MSSLLFRLYDKVVLDNPRAWLGIIVLLGILFGWHVQNFKLDASADSLVLENDADLHYYRATNKVYGSNDFLVITYAPFEGLMSENSLTGPRELAEDLKKLERVKSVVSILNVPLLYSPKIKISKLEDAHTLETPGVDKKMALKEFTESPIYRKLLASIDGKTTAVLVKYKRDEKYSSLLEKRTELREKKSRSSNPGRGKNPQTGFARVQTISRGDSRKAGQRNRASTGHS